MYSITVYFIRKTLTIGRLLVWLLVASILTIQANSVYAVENFTTDMQVQYRVRENGDTQITYDIDLKNNFSTVYAKEYVLELNSTDVSEVSVRDSEGEDLPFNQAAGTNTTSIQISFPQERRVLGKDKAQSFTISFVSQDAATVYGQVLEVAVPKLADPEAIGNYQVTIEVPPGFGEPSLVEPTTYNVERTQIGTIVEFKNVGQDQGISVLFGDAQTYDLQLKYHLENTSQNVGVVQVALPPDTAFQQMNYQSIEPQPQQIFADADGNWIAEFRLEGQDQVQVNVVAQATVFAQARQEYKVNSPLREAVTKQWWQGHSEADFLKPTEFWPVDNPLIAQLSSQYQSPQTIYNYTVDTLDYNYQRFANNQAPGRLGALAALEDPANAVCTEFTDVFVTLARGAGIPARRVTGYAVTQNSRLRPLSLVADVLHAWPEYFDAQQGLWIPIDPTWADTTGGVDYFSKLDLRHVAFAIQGQHDTRPLAAGMYKIAGQEGKDIQVDLASEPRNNSSQIVIDKEPSLLPRIGLPTVQTVTVTNQSGVAAYNLEVAFGITGNIELLSDPVVNIPVLLPYQQQEITVELAGNDWLQASTGQLHVLLNEQEETYRISARKAVDARLRQPWILGGVVVLLSLGSGGLLVLIARGINSLRR